MSRPHHRRQSFLPFGNPFRMIIPKGSYYLSPKLLPLLNSFEQTLADNLKKLKPDNISDVLSLAWLRQAMEFLSETHSNVKTLITDLQFPVSDWDEKWVDIYLDSSVKLLDICIALSSELSRLGQGQLLLQYVLHILDSSDYPSSEHLERLHASLHDWIKQMTSRSSRLENCSLILPGLAATLYVVKVKNSAQGKVLTRVLYGVKVVTVCVCSVLVAVLLGCAIPLTELHVSNKFLWAEAFNNLQADVNREIKNRFSSGKVMAQELEVVEACVVRLHGMTGCAGHKEDETVQKSNGVSQLEVGSLGGSPNHAERDKVQESISEETVQRSNDVSQKEVRVLRGSANHEEQEKLQESVSEEILQGSNGVRQKELGSLGGSTNHEEREKWRESVLELAERAQGLARGLELFSKQVGDFFQIVLTGRDALLCNLREPDVMQECKVDEKVARW